MLTRAVVATPPTTTSGSGLEPWQALALFVLVPLALLLAVAAAAWWSARPREAGAFPVLQRRAPTHNEQEPPTGPSSA